MGNSNTDYNRGYLIFTLNSLNALIHNFDKLSKKSLDVLFNDDLIYPLRFIIVFPNYTALKIKASIIIGALTYFSNDFIQKLSDQDLINSLIEVLEGLEGLDTLTEYILTILSNILSINDNFLIKKTNFLNYLINLLIKNQEKDTINLRCLFLIIEGLLDKLDKYAIEDDKVVK